ncbi:MAG: energy transducer TonB [Gemmatimonadota bacterium]
MKNRRELAREEKKSRQQLETANDRFQRRNRDLSVACILIATGMHFSLFQLNPRMQIGNMETTGEEIVAMTLPPDVQIPPPPQSIARPATPRVSAGPVAEEITMAPTTFDANPVESLLPPPVDVKRQEKDSTPFYVPRDVEPRLLNGSEVAMLLEQNYPRTLCEAGIEGRVVLWVYVSVEGKSATCLVHSSSGYPMLDEAAKKVAGHMRFAPALNMDKPVAVWIAQPVEFSVS